jgi:hypothetical protein
MPLSLSRREVGASFVRGSVPPSHRQRPVLIDHGLRNGLELCDLAFQPPQTGLDPQPLFVHLAEGLRERFDPPAPLIPLLDPQENRIEVHRSRTDGGGVQPFAEGAWGGTGSETPWTDL